MKETSNIKDKLSTFCGILIAIAGSVLVAGQSGLVLPTWLTATAGSIVAIGTGIIGYLTGKAPNAIKKVPTQVVQQNVKENEQPTL